MAAPAVAANVSGNLEQRHAIRNRVVVDFEIGMGRPQISSQSGDQGCVVDTVPPSQYRLWHQLPCKANARCEVKIVLWSSEREGQTRLGRSFHAWDGREIGAEELFPARRSERRLSPFFLSMVARSPWSKSRLSNSQRHAEVDRQL